jgi:hypothetical protein
MAPESSLSDPEVKVLLALWKLRGTGKNHVKEEALRADLAMAGLESGCIKEVASLHDRGFLQSVTVEGGKEISLTALGLALLRQIEEDKLEELK